MVTVLTDCEVGNGYPWKELPVNTMFTLRVMEHPFLSKVIIATPGQSLTAKILFPYSQYSKEYKESVETAFLTFGVCFFMFYSEWGRKKLSKIFGQYPVTSAK